MLDNTGSAEAPPLKPLPTRSPITPVGTGPVTQHPGNVLGYRVNITNYRRRLWTYAETARNRRQRHYLPKLCDT